MEELPSYDLTSPHVAEDLDQIGSETQRLQRTTHEYNHDDPQPSPSLVI